MKDKRTEEKIGSYELEDRREGRKGKELGRGRQGRKESEGVAREKED